jgi:hypothetical protein
MKVAADGQKRSVWSTPPDVSKSRWPMKIEKDTITFNSGRKAHATLGIVGINSQLELFDVVSLDIRQIRLKQLVIPLDIVAVCARKRSFNFHHATAPAQISASTPTSFFLVFGRACLCLFS